MAMLESKGQLKTEKQNISRNDKKVENRSVRSGEETLRHDVALRHSEDPLRSSEPGDQSLKGLGYAAAKQPS